MNKYSFTDILSKEIVIDEKENKSIVFEKIEIPMIQRDYAQGRENETEVRRRFLDAIFDALENEKKLDMDFVYGSITELNKIFIPLDGQQRLTTLFLIHWYIGLRELKENDYMLLMKLLNKFTYSTRVSSRRFCKKLVEARLTFENEPKIEIINLSWFYKSYQKDPTIKAMLNMLNAIHEKYIETNKTNLFSNLQLLQFYILPLNGFNLSEELYVKMNARGKQLTDFENFKADITKWMQDENNPYNNEYQKEVTLNDRKMPYYLSLSQKLDNEWTHFFWNMTKYYNIEEKDKNGNLIYLEGKIIDPLFLRLFYRYFLNKYIYLSKIEIKSIDKEIDYQFFDKEQKNHDFNSFKRVLVIENLLPLFEKFFDSLTKNWDKIQFSIQPSWQSENKFWTFFDNNITQSERVVFLAITLFLEKNNYDDSQFKQWMRVVWNIVENTDISDAPSMIGVMKLINELAQNSHQIHVFLADDNSQIISTSSKNALFEERQKSKYIVSDNEWESVFINAENHPFFKGSIGFILTHEMTQKEFIHRTELAFKVFNNKGVNDKYRENGHIFLRALISRHSGYELIQQRNFTDRDESEHYLKKMLSSSQKVRNTIQEWFNLRDESELQNKLNEEIEKDSQITVNDWEKIKIRRAHEALYKAPDLQIWMQQHGAIRFAWNNGHFWISRPRSWYDWILLESIRNIAILELLKSGFTTEQNCQIGQFFIGSHISLIGKLPNSDVEIKLTFDNDRNLKIEFKNAENWFLIKTYDYVNEDDKLLDILSLEIFNPTEFDKLINSTLKTEEKER